ncbi:hypothetical protein [Shewanella gaetbuli]|uniref:Lipoprotein n=1 Tax=Shewanella gaetbuli TaxID=220752 RepID=A0A9X2CMH1_9GAMM|nr:hypothetical protein [Shewanella gaetbuli]MCL1143675.1 hypothetical protein [Shewanella gaetbuli]
MAAQPRVKFLLPFALATFMLTGCIKSPEWTLFYFADTPNKTDLSLNYDAIKGYYNTLEQCQAKGAGIVRIQGVEITEQVDFICGQQCQIADDNQVSCSQLVSDKDFLKQL